MATPQSSTPSPRQAAARKAAETRAKDAIALLKADHRKVEGLFAKYEEAKANDARKQQIFQQIAMELRIHMQLEEEIFYPQSREFVEEEDTVNEAEVEHAAAKDLMAQLEGMSPSDEMYDAKVTVLQEQIEHHVEEEEEEYFPEVKKNGMDTRAVGEEIMARKQELVGRMDGAGRRLQ
ncbi:MAG: hemerythrin cation binding region [Phenylobacterium sp.]|jgi:iron-sulfur cluster repair protein YtfE (RIC family)|nr:hemerythrin cation binding region [Phenylobacterium sp.]